MNGHLNKLSLIALAFLLLALLSAPPQPASAQSLPAPVISISSTGLLTWEPVEGPYTISFLITAWCVMEVVAVNGLCLIFPVKHSQPV